MHNQKMQSIPKTEYQTKSRPLSLIIILLSGGFILSTITSSLIGWQYHPLRLNENQILYLFSTSSQVISGIYGLTLTGLIFFINELNREQTQDETLEASIRELKYRYYSFLLFITLMVCICLGIGNTIISTEATGPSIYNTILINSGQSAFAFSLISIIIFIFEVIDPKALERASDRVKENLDPYVQADLKGSLEEFMRNFNQIEAILSKYGESYEYSSIVSSQNRARRRLSNTRLAEILFRNEKIDRNLLEKTRELISIRNSIVHGADPAVSRTLVTESESVLKMIISALQIE